MTGPEHYRTAETCIEQAGIESGSGNDEDARGFLMAAQVHATLALAAATYDYDWNHADEAAR
jgi:hypothetical protein